ncbi:MAG TPA: hypothetical protein VGA56_03450 [Opitutaceae bacterium]
MKPRLRVVGLRAVRPWQLAALLLAAVAAGLVSDCLRTERVVFPPPLPEFTTIPSGG